MRRDFEFWAVGAGSCVKVGWEIYNDANGVLLGRFERGQGQPGNLYATLPYHFAFDGLFLVRAIATLAGGSIVVRDRVVDTLAAVDRDINFYIFPAEDRPAKPTPRKDATARRTHDNLREVFG